MKNVRLLTLFAFAGLTLASCKKDDEVVPTPSNPNETELITSMKLIMTNASNSANVIEAEFNDLDGDGGNAPTLDTIRLESGTTYNVQILLMDKTKNPVDTISYEVEEEDDEHQFFSTATNASVTFSYSDADDNGVPVGLSSSWVTGAATTTKDGKITIILKHQGEDKPNTGNGDVTIGDTDIEVNFPILISNSIK